MIALDRDAPPFASLLPHSLLLDPDAGVLLLTQPTKRWKPGLALGCAWRVEPKNIEVIDEAACLDLSRTHESLLRSLPVGAALQSILTITPSTTAPAWETLRAGRPDDALLTAQREAICAGLPHQDGATQGRLRIFETLVTFRLPLPPLGGELMLILTALLTLPTRSGAHIAAVFQQHLDTHLAAFDGIATGIEATLRAAGHGVMHLDGQGLGHALGRSLAPHVTDEAVILDDLPLREQVLSDEADTVPGGVTSGTETAQVLSLHRAPPQTYPGILCAPRAPHGSQPLALWQAWDGPLTIVTNIAVVDQASAKAELEFKRFWANLHGQSVENAALKEELDRLLTQYFLTGGQFVRGRVHLVLWGQEPALTQGIKAVCRAARQLDLEFTPEPTLGSTLFVSTVPLGFDPAWPREKYVRRARRLPGRNIADLLVLYGGFRGTATASILLLNQGGETVTWDPFDSQTASHGVIIGKSGSGKSFNMGHLANQVLPLGASMVILDRLPSYQELCDWWGGTYLEMGGAADACFNPFHGDRGKEHRMFLTASLAEMASGGHEFLSRESMGVLGEAVGAFLDTWDARRGEPHLGQFVEEVLRDGCFSPTDKRARRVGQELARKLGLYYGRGPYASYIDGPNTLVLHPQLTVIELSRLEKAPDLQATLLFALLHLLQVFFSAPDRRHVAKYFLCDESVFLIKHPGTAAVLEEIAVTYRKLRTSAWFLAQQAKQLASPAGQALIDNAGAVLFLQQESGEIAKMADLFELTSSEVQAFDHVVKHTHWSSGYLRLPGKTGGVVRLIPDAMTQLLLGQDERTRQRRLQKIAEVGGDIQGIHAS